jgi:hypothetical protein
MMITANNTRISRSMKLNILLIAALCSSATLVDAKPVALTQRTFVPAVENYLRDSGDLCVGKFDWPITVTAHDREIGASNAVQMPVLEKLGLVTVSETPDAHPREASQGVDSVTRYELTEEGKKFYLVKKTTSLGPGDQPVVHQGDFCVAKLSLNKVISWDAPKVVDGQQQTTVAYTYHIVAADWTRNAQLQQVFPRVGLVVRGEGTLQLKESFRLTKRGWVAVTLGN